MSNFNFGSFENKSAINTSSFLKPWNIYDVKFDGIEREELHKKNDESVKYKTIKVSFSNSAGRFIKNLFIPDDTPENSQRGQMKRQDGSTYPTPSRFEEFKWTLLQLAQVLNSEGFSKLQKVANKIKTMDQFVDALIKLIDAKKGMSTKIKLIGKNRDGSVYADFPYVTAIGNDDEPYVRNNFVGNNVAFTSYEASQAANYNTAKPTEIHTESTTSSSDDDLDFSSLSDEIDNL